MAWIKKNLAFVVSSAVALILLVVAVVFLFSNRSRDAAIQEELNQELANWQGLNTGSSFPNQENIDAAKKEQEKIREFLKQAAAVIPSSSPAPKLTDQAFVTLLGNKISELRTSAENAGVALPQQYDFTFSAQRKSLDFPAGSIESWLPQLSDIESICSVLYRARVNALDSILRVPVSLRDTGTAEYLDTNTTMVVSNQFAVYTPYQVSFRAFSGELAAVLREIEQSTNFMLVKSLAVVPAAGDLGGGDGSGSPVYVPRTIAPVYSAPQRSYGGGKDGGGVAPRPAPVPVYQQQRQRTVAGATAETVLSEQPLQVTLLLDVVKQSSAQ